MISIKALQLQGIDVDKYLNDLVDSNTILIAENTRLRERLERAERIIGGSEKTLLHFAHSNKERDAVKLFLEGK